MRFSFGTVLGTALSLLFCFDPAWGATLDPKVQGALAAAKAGETVSVIVAFDAPETVATLAQDAGRKGPSGVVRTLRARADGSQGQVRTMLKGKGKSYRPLWIINALAVEAEPDLVRALAAQPGVREVRLNGTVPLPEVRPAQAGSFWNLSAVRAPELWNQGVVGTGVTVAVIDSGVDVTHPLLGPKWRGQPGGWFNPYAAGCAAPGAGCTACESSASIPCDAPALDDPGDPGHGTAVAGVILGGDGTTTTGVAPGAKWIAAKIFRDSGFADFAAIHAALQWALDPDGNPATADAPAVVNNSWGIENAINECFTEFQPDVQALRAAGIAVVFASGNGGPAPATSISPGNYPESLAVGAMAPDGTIASFSARGPSACGGVAYPAVTAPGVEIHTTSAIPESRFVNISGTSFSAPHLSGVLALLKQAAPAATVLHLEAAIRGAARDLGPAGIDNDYGHGLVDAVASLEALRRPPTAAQPIFPENGATTGAEVTFRWNPGSTPDGQPVNDTLLVSESPDFATSVAGNSSGGRILLAGSGGLLASIGLLALRRRRRLALLLLAFGLALLAACGGGSSSGGSDPPPGVAKTVSNLRPGATYYWKIVSENSVGGTTDSEVRTFIVR